jgi:DNA-binding PucR family transcriptional regulator
MLAVHPNTLRYRLRRFEEMTNASLRRTEDLFETWWALERLAFTEPGAKQRRP